jgi:hypothetical protein
MAIVQVQLESDSKQARGPPNKFVVFWRKVYRPLGFSKDYNFPLYEYKVSLIDAETDNSNLHIRWCHARLLSRPHTSTLQIVRRVALPMVLLLENGTGIAPTTTAMVSLSISHQLYQPGP